MSRAPMHTARAVLVALALTVLMTCLLTPLTARPAAACNVGIGYRPTVKIDLTRRSDSGPFGGGDACSTEQSLAGVAVVVVAVLGAIGVLGTNALRKGELAAGGRQQGEQVLASYLHATGTTPPAPPPQGGPYSGQVSPFPPPQGGSFRPPGSFPQPPQGGSVPPAHEGSSPPAQGGSYPPGQGGFYPPGQGGPGGHH